MTAFYIGQHEIDDEAAFAENSSRIAGTFCFQYFERRPAHRAGVCYSGKRMRFCARLRRTLPIETGSA